MSAAPPPPAADPGVPLEAGSRWRVHPRFVLRLAGLPFGLLEQLACPGALAEVKGALGRAAEAEQRRRALLAQLAGHVAADREELKALRRVWRLLKGSPVERPVLPPGLAGLQGAADLFFEASTVSRQAWSRAEAAALEAFDEARARLWALAQRPDFREALFLVNPGAELTIGSQLPSGPRNQKMRGRERLLTLFLQRLCSKNETNSFFGPVASGRVAEGGAVSGALGSELPLRRVVHASYWAAELLAEQIAHLPDLAARLRVRRSPTAWLEPGRVIWEEASKEAPGSWSYSVVRRSAELDEDTARLVQQANGQTLEALAAALGWELDDTRQAVETLGRAGILEFGLAPGSGDVAALATVGRALEGLGSVDPRVAELQRGLGALQEGLADFAQAPLEGRRRVLAQMADSFVGLTGAGSQRHAGQLYADRMLLSEDCRAPVDDFVLGEGLLQANASALAVICELSLLRLRHRRARVREWFARRFGKGQALRFIDVEAAADQDGVLGPSEDQAPLAPFRALFAEASAGKQAQVRIDSAVLRARLPSLPDEPLYLPVDLLLCRGDPAPTLVLGEIQYGFFVAHDVFTEAFEPQERAQFRAAQRRLIDALAGGRPVAELVRPHESRADLRVPLVEYELLMNLPRCRPQVAPDKVLRLVDTRVELREDGFHFFDPLLGEFVPLMRLGCHALLQALAPIVPGMAYPDQFPPPGLLPDPVDGHAPRVTIDEVVLSRRQRVFSRAALLEALGESPGSLLAGASALFGVDEPQRHWFARIPGERKPVYVDLASPLLLDALRSLTGASKAEAITFTEMLPGPEELLLQAPQGPRTSEIRTCFYLAPAR